MTPSPHSHPSPGVGFLFLLLKLRYSRSGAPRGLDDSNKMQVAWAPPLTTGLLGVHRGLQYSLAYLTLGPHSATTYLSQSLPQLSYLHNSSKADPKAFFGVSCAHSHSKSGERRGHHCDISSPPSPQKEGVCARGKSADWLGRSTLVPKKMELPLKGRSHKCDKEACPDCSGANEAQL